MREIPEIQLQKLLCEGFLVSRDLQCDTGKKIKILSIGEWNRGSGPDFKNCRIRQGSREEIGDIEVHKSIGEWYEHRHHLDPHYENVELHLTLFRGRGEKVRNSRGRVVPQISLEENMTPEELSLLEDYASGEAFLNPYAQPNECQHSFAHVDNDRLRDHIYELGWERITGKSFRFTNRIRKAGYQQTIYEGLFESAGYSANKVPFLLLANNLPLRKIREILQWTPPGDRIITAEAAYLGISGLLDRTFNGVDNDFDIEGALRLFEIKKQWRRIRSSLTAAIMKPGTVSFHGTRPGNSPLRTLSGLAHFMAYNYSMNVFSLFKSLLLDNSPESNKITNMVRDLLNSADDRYWRNRYNFEGGNFLISDFFGRDRVNRFIGNILTPIFLHYAREKKSRKLESALMEIAGSLPAAHNKFTKKIYYSWNTETRKTMKMTFLLEQGLLGHYANFCTPQRCERCKSICNIR